MTRATSEAGVISLLMAVVEPITPLTLCLRAPSCGPWRRSPPATACRPSLYRRASKRYVERHGLSVERDGQERVRRVNVAEYDGLRQKFGDTARSKAARAEPKAEPEPAPPPALPAGGVSSESYDEALRQKTWYDAELKRIQLEEMKARLVDASEMAKVIDRMAGIFRDVMARHDDGADEIAAAVGRAGVRGAELEQKRLRGELTATFVAALTAEAAKLRSATQ